ncbi:MAG: type II secretion system F family protein [Planctomycetes bacterium]|nr:type II secretion system F family protein [Planctomycetota bacterium]
MPASIQTLLVLGMLLVAAVSLFAWAAQRLALRGRTLDRLFSEQESNEPLPAEDQQGWLKHWLFLAGRRGPNAVAVYVGSTLVFCIGGGLLALAFTLYGNLPQMARVAQAIPGGVGDVALPLIYGAPWIALVCLASIPTLLVRAARRQRVREIEEDLPLVLDLLATLAEAGLGLDSAIDRVLGSLEAHRTLPRELSAFQRDVLAGRPRVDSLRWLSRRVGMTWFSIFISAVVQAEQIGAGLADVLKIQAEDLRQRRKEQALAFAMSTPIKLLVPMVVCFMPGVLLSALGPAFYEIFRVLDSMSQSAR